MESTLTLINTRGFPSDKSIISEQEASFNNNFLKGDFFFIMDKAAAFQSEEEKVQYKREQENFFETRRRKEKLSEKDKRLFERLEKVNVGRYDVTFSVASMIAEVYQNSAIEAFNTIFALGFMKGQIAEKATRKGNKR